MSMNIRGEREGAVVRIVLSRPFDIRDVAGTAQPERTLAFGGGFNRSL
jgi:hypothetical protein